MLLEINHNVRLIDIIFSMTVVSYVSYGFATSVEKIYVLRLFNIITSQAYSVLLSTLNFYSSWF